MMIGPDTLSSLFMTYRKSPRSLGPLPRIKALLVYPRIGVAPLTETYSCSAGDCGRSGTKLRDELLHAVAASNRPAGQREW
jgi:hypothetical protein